MSIQAINNAVTDFYTFPAQTLAPAEEEPQPSPSEEAPPPPPPPPPEDVSSPRVASPPPAPGEATRESLPPGSRVWQA